MNNTKSQNLTPEKTLILGLLDREGSLSVSEILKFLEGKLNDTETRASLSSLTDQNLINLQIISPDSDEITEIHEYGLTDVGKQILVFSEEKNKKVTNQEKKHLGETEEVKEQLWSILSHTVVIIFALVTIFLVHNLLDILLGKDAVILGLIKVKYIIEAGDLMVLLSWLLVVIINSFKIVWKLLKKK